jgi:hypothetical protein
MDLIVRVMGGVTVAHWTFRPCGPIRRLVTASRFASTVSTAAIKTADRSLRCPPHLSLS